MGILQDFVISCIQSHRKNIFVGPTLWQWGYISSFMLQVLSGWKLKMTNCHVESDIELQTTPLTGLLPVNTSSSTPLTPSVFNHEGKIKVWIFPLIEGLMLRKAAEDIFVVGLNEERGNKQEKESHKSCFRRRDQNRWMWGKEELPCSEESFFLFPRIMSFSDCLEYVCFLWAEY